MPSASLARRAAGPLARRLAAAGAALAAATALLTGCTPPGASSAPNATLTTLAQQVAAAEADPTATAPASIADSALAVLAALEVAPRTDWDGYFDRTGSFGDGWGDPDGNGCDARNDALRAAMTDEELRPDGCRVATGTFTDPYSGETVEFVAGPTTSERVQVDHVVALYAAWRTGAQDLTLDERIAFANDPLNLQPTLDWVNDDKQAADASRWLPPNEAYRCTYVARQIAVKASYGLWVTQAEHDAMREVLEGCSG